MKIVLWETNQRETTKGIAHTRRVLEIHWHTPFTFTRSRAARGRYLSYFWVIGFIRITVYLKDFYE